MKSLFLLAALSGCATIDERVPTVPVEVAEFGDLDNVVSNYAMAAGDARATALPGVATTLFLAVFTSPAGATEVTVPGPKGEHMILADGVGFKAIVESTYAEYKCVTRQNHEYDAEVPPDELEINQLAYEICYLTEMLLHKSPVKRIDSLASSYARVVHRIETSRNPAVVRRLPSKAAVLLGKRWEMEQFVNITMGAPCDPRPGDLVVTYSEGVARHYPVTVDARMCGG